MDTDYFTELANLTRISWILLIPVGLLLCVVLYQLAVLIATSVDIIKLARHEAAPMLQDLKQITSHVESLSSKANDTVTAVENSAKSVGPWVKNQVTHGSSAARSGLSDAFSFIKAAVSGLAKSVSKP